jgi:MFS family permease
MRRADCARRPREEELSAVEKTSTTSTELAASKWGAFVHAAFTVNWVASIVSYIGTAMFDTASDWLMTSLSADPLAVSLVQVAVSLPLFLFTLPAGALADVIDSRRLLILVESVVVVVSAIFAALVSFCFATTGALLVATFLLGIGVR